MASGLQPVLKKRRYQNIEVKPLPTDCKMVGYFTGLDVELFDREAIKILNNCGSFGENSRPRQALARNEKTRAKELTKEEYDRKLDWREKFGGSESEKKPMVMIDGDEEKLVEDPFEIPNSQVLCPEEAMFLHRELECLDVRDTNDRPLIGEDLWNEFCELNENFPANYAAYVYLKSKNWVIKSGSKFGGQFVLYKQSPKYYHASFIVKLIIKDSKCEPRTTYEHQTSERIAENTKKAMLYLEIDCPTDLNPAHCYNTLDKFTVKEMVFQRHVVKKLSN